MSSINNNTLSPQKENVRVKAFCVNPLGVNCYVVSDESEGVIIDCGALGREEWQSIERYIEQEGILLRHALQTHLHFDHIFGLDLLRDRYGLTAQAHPAERAVWDGNHELLQRMGGRFVVHLPVTTPDFSLTDGQTISFGQTELRIIHTPGHTPGGVCFYCESEGQLFSGDTLFQGSYGRYDLPGGSYRQLMDSITQRLLTLPADTCVRPGHGGRSAIGYERQWFGL